MRLAPLMDLFNQHVHGKVEPNCIRMSEDVYRDYLDSIPAKNIEAKIYFMGADIICDPDLGPKEIEFCFRKKLEG